MKKDYKITIAKSAKEFEEGRILFMEYASSLGFDLCFQNFDTELKEIAFQYNKPYGALILIKHNEQFIGCAGIRCFKQNVAELKRMFIKPEYRALGLGRKLMHFAIDFSIKTGYKFIRLDTMKTMKTAINIYKACGFYEIESYRFNPSDDVLFMEKKL
ncbi:MAG: GNAT family N-acetyltransferase [Bacteroidota bacterium]